MNQCKGVIITGKNTMTVSSQCPVPEEPCPTGALIRPLIWSPCTSDAHLCATGCASLPYLLGKAVGHEMCGVITKVGCEVRDFKVGQRVIVCSVMPVWRSLEAQDGMAKQHQDNMYAGVDFPDRGGSFVEEYEIRDADMNLAPIPEGVTLEQAVMVPDMMCTAFEGVSQLAPAFGSSVVVLGIGPVGLMAVRAAVLHGAGNVFAVGSRQVCFEVAKEYGATHLVDYHNEDYLQQIVKDNGGPVDGVILCGGSEKELGKGLSILKKGGTLVNMSAYFGGSPIEIDPSVWGFGYGDKTIKGVGCRGGRLWMARMAKLIACGRVAPEKLITHRYHGMEKIPQAMNLFLNRDRGLIKPVIYND
ncbi:MAG TPA: zinc-binding dehydrogenase [Candidatus Gallacutalibacter stercoravium]|nr:zinc-binding dehydrogenase [Candidatus Gallacutalibacter stercoravium]